MNETPSAELIRELAWQSPTIQKLNDRFRHICEHLDILTIYEKKPTATLRQSRTGELERTGLPEMMVEKDAALLYQHRETSIGLEQDHSSIAKVARGQNGCYDDIVYFLRRSISSAVPGTETQQSYLDSAPIGSTPHTGRDNDQRLPGLPIRGSGSRVTFHSQNVIYHKSTG